MNRLSMLLAVTAALYGAALAADEPALRQRLQSQDGWVGYRVPMAADAGSPCCYSGDAGGDLGRTGCDLDARKGGYISDRASPAGSSELSVYWHMVDGKADQVRAFAADCPVSSRQPVRWIDAVDARDSISALTRWVESEGARRKRDSSGLVAIAMHGDAEATTTLIGFAEATASPELGKEAIFWLGHARGKRGADYVEKVASTNPRPEFREHAVFALSQSKENDAYERVRAVSQRDASGDVRGKALFWMAQMHDPRAEADILAALDREKTDDVREEAVFALSQLDETRATAALIAVVRGDYPRPVKEKALFWLGQAGTDEALAFLDSVLSR